jgi:hypothetical protein
MKAVTFAGHPVLRHSNIYANNTEYSTNTASDVSSSQKCFNGYEENAAGVLHK